MQSTLSVQCDKLRTNRILFAVNERWGQWRMQKRKERIWNICVLCWSTSSSSDFYWIIPSSDIAVASTLNPRINHYD